MRRLHLASSAALIIAIALVIPAYSGDVQKNASHREQQKTREFNALQERAAALAKEWRSSDERESSGAKKKWEKLVADFDAWAKKYNAATKRETAPFAAAPIGGAKHRCPLVDADGPGYFCVLIYEGPNICVYRCYKY
jgi:hypothetical protein